MSTVNTKARIARPAPRTHEGAVASRINATQELRRSVMACMLWEDQFYEDGQSIADRIAALIPQVKAETVAEIAIEAREQMKLRHIPLLLVKQMAGLDSHKHVVASTLERIIQRVDELTEFLAIYQIGRTGTKKLNKLSKQVQRGLAKAFTKFDEYQLAKYNRDTDIKLRDVLFLCHAKPKDEAQAAMWKRLIAGELKTPDTWEVEISASKDKKASWERLLGENKLGAMALLRNLRNMQEAKVSETLVVGALDKMKAERVLPFRFISAAKYAPQWEPQLEQAMFKCLAGAEKLSGKTLLVVDTSGSMHSGNVSAKSELTRVDAATALAILAREICENVAVYATAGDDGRRVHATKQVPARRGFALSDAIWGRHMQSAIGGGGIFLRQSLDFLYEKEGGVDRIIVLTDEQDCDTKLTPDTAKAFGKYNYIINVASFKNGIGYGKFTKIDGWSEAVISYIREFEKTDAVQ